jgi:hypothetical protein
MKTTRPFLAWAATAAFGLGSLLFTSGCVATAAAGAGAAAAAWVKGEIEVSLNARYDRTVTASNKAVEQLGFTKVSEKKDALLDTIVARTSADKKVEVRLDNVGDTVTKVHIRVGTFGDKDISMAVLDKIRANL